MAKRCTHRFFTRDAETVARELLGCTLVRMLDGQRLAGRIVETEAYIGPLDQASHARNNRRTPRTEPMFGPPGLSYVYFTYGMHFCMNVSCAAKDDPQAVLIRALQPVEGQGIMQRLRGRHHPVTDLCRGPARLCQALNIGPDQNALDTLTSDTLWFERGKLKKGESIACSPRIGLGDKGDWTHRELRFFIAGSPYVSGRVGVGVTASKLGTRPRGSGPATR